MNSKDGTDFAILFTLRERRRTSDSALSRIRSKILRLHPRRLDSEALRRLQSWGLLHIHEPTLTQSTQGRAIFRHGLHGARQGRGQFVAVAQPHVPAEIFGRLN